MMGRYALRNKNVLTTKNVVKKFSREIPVNNSFVRGVFTIKNYRKYQFREEVEINFKGEIYVMVNRKKDWYDSSLMDYKEKGFRVSIIKVNRFIRKNILFSLKTHLKYFDVDLKSYNDIQKIKWL